MRELATLTNPVSVAESTLEREFVDIFSDLADLFGYPRSYGAIYGLLFLLRERCRWKKSSGDLRSAKDRQVKGCVSSRSLARFRGRGRMVCALARTSRGLSLSRFSRDFSRKRLAPRSGTSRLQRLKTVLPAFTANSSSHYSPALGQGNQVAQAGQRFSAPGSEALAGRVIALSRAEKRRSLIA